MKMIALSCFISCFGATTYVPDHAEVSSYAKTFLAQHRAEQNDEFKLNISPMPYSAMAEHTPLATYFSTTGNRCQIYLSSYGWQHWDNFSQFFPEEKAQRLMQGLVQYGLLHEYGHCVDKSRVTDWQMLGVNYQHYKEQSTLKGRAAEEYKADIYALGHLKRINPAVYAEIAEIVVKSREVEGTATYQSTSSPLAKIIGLIKANELGTEKIASR